MGHSDRQGINNDMNQENSMSDVHHKYVCHDNNRDFITQTQQECSKNFFFSGVSRCSPFFAGI
jgi:hypothetical protein